MVAAPPVPVETTAPVIGFSKATDAPRPLYVAGIPVMFMVVVVKPASVIV